MNSIELKNILNLHEKWLKKEPDGKRADLSYADLRLADLGRANLSKANLCGANLSAANLSGANLSGANLSKTDLHVSNLYESNISCADLSWSDMRFSNLYRAFLNEADLSYADISKTNLKYADLSGANLYSADLSGTDLYMANLIGAKNINCPILCPEKGSFIGFKKANGLIVELEIPSDALRSSATTRKCRCSKAKVISITNLDGSSSGVTSIPSSWNCNFIYSIGDIVEVADFDTNRWNECSSGIHFFITRQEAVNYY